MVWYDDSSVFLFGDNVGIAGRSGDCLPRPMSGRMICFIWLLLYYVIVITQVQYCIISYIMYELDNTVPHI